MAQDQCIVLGDLNAKIEVDAQGFPYPETDNGKLLLNLVAENGLDIVNLSSKCTGKWTHVVRTSGEMSRLDYVLASSEFQSNIISMTVDETCLLCPFSQKTCKGTPIQQYSDHNTITLQFTLPRGSNSDGKPKDVTKRWRITEDGLAMFHQLTNWR